MCLSLLNRSHPQVQRSQLHFVDDDQTIATKAILMLVKMFLIVLALANVVQSHQTAMVHNVDDLLARAISQTTFGRLHFSASNAVVRQDWIVIHPRSTARIVRRDLPVDIAVLLDCSEQSQSNEVLVQQIPATCRISGLDSSLIRNAIDQLGTAPLLTKANGLVQGFIRQNDISEPQGLNPDVQGIANISKSNVKSLGLVDWEATAPVALTVQPIQPRHMLRPDWTYLMIGMTGAMGISLCQWAIRNGARSIVLTSRNPSVDEDWLIETRSLGADVQVWPMEIASRAAVGSVISRINSTMPQLVGGCNGTMVLNDKLFLDMDAQGMNAALEPKFRGSQIIDKVLGDQDLDFFILLSSCAMPIGNPSQTNYHAANLYMASLAANRRTPRSAASIIHLSYIADVGYVTRQDQSMRERLEQLPFCPLCESDIHNTFAEAIRASRPNGRDDPFDFAINMSPCREYVPPNFWDITTSSWTLSVSPFSSGIYIQHIRLVHYNGEWPFKRLYRTGDQGRLLEDGSLLFMGRLDGNTQIQLNGVRIESEKVEGAILAGSDGKLSTAVAAAHKDRLLAYATLTTGISLTETEIKQLLIYASLPLLTTMQPSKLIIMDTLPLTSAGKINQEAIQDLAMSGQPNRPISSSGTINRLILRQGELRLLWKKVLGGPDRSFGHESDFFHVGETQWPSCACKEP
ncbi:PKS-NRPS protein [Penicillium vulpinum]|uniref:PKS-NRPS protein n=1 Tax=Penicillium vulpinum TaxID=29845 RepID=UPI0025489F6C|nr:PKS-NRPS protein [Penicillium vulpinum]KAJ5960988.1 PKS-NRPS protein [Penicillium vulpinum]